MWRCELRDMVGEKLADVWLAKPSVGDHIDIPDQANLLMVEALCHVTRGGAEDCLRLTVSRHRKVVVE